MDPLLPRLLDPVYRVCIWSAGISIACMSLIIPWGIFARYVLGSDMQAMEMPADQMQTR